MTRNFLFFGHPDAVSGSCVAYLQQNRTLWIVMLHFILFQGKMPANSYLALDIFSFQLLVLITYLQGWTFVPTDTS